MQITALRQGDPILGQSRNGVSIHSWIRTLHAEIVRQVRKPWRYGHRTRVNGCRATAAEHQDRANTAREKRPPR